MSDRRATERHFSPEELDEQFINWARRESRVAAETENVKTQIAAELEYARSMDVREFTLWRKHNQLQELAPSHGTNTLWGPAVQPSAEQLTKIHRVRNSIWVPNSPDDVLRLEPELISVKEKIGVPATDIWGEQSIEPYANPDPLAEDWRILRILALSGEYAPPVGRSMPYLVRDRVSGHYLGMICISSDFMDLAPRERAIGWDQQSRVINRRLNHTATGSTIVPTQPLGFSYVGGKLCALLCLSREVANNWQERYGDVLVALTTTSLYGQVKSQSQYSNLRPWSDLGVTKGSVPLQLTRANEQTMKYWMRANYPREYWELFVAQDRRGMPLRRDSINRAYQFCYRRLGFQSHEFTSEHQRGVYLARLYENTDHFLREKISPNRLKPAFENSTQHLTAIWKTKHALPRVKSLVQQGRFSRDVLFYDDMIGTTWLEARAKYLRQVGR